MADKFMQKYRPLQILYIFLDFSTWQSAKTWSYATQLAFEEGFAANGVKFLSLPAICGLSSSIPASWLSRARDFCAGKTFDQVWVELVHSPLDTDFLEWLTEIAPVRVGILPESLDSDPTICNMVENLDKRRVATETRLQYMTHVLAGDEADAESLNLKGNVRALWWVNAIPQRCIVNEVPPQAMNGAIFPGSVYPWRQQWFDNPQLEGLFQHLSGPEKGTQLPELFDSVNRIAAAELNLGAKIPDEGLTAYLNAVRHIRRECNRLWIEALQTGCAVVNFPSVVKAHTGRVLESMAAGRPVVTWQIPERPRTAALFSDGKEILLYPADQPDVLVEHIKRLKMEPQWAAEIAQNALTKIRRHHTMEHRVRQILDWLETGQEPSYSDAAATSLTDVINQVSASFCCSKALSIENQGGNDIWPDENSLLEAASIALTSKDISRAINILESAVTKFPDVTVLLGSLLYQLGEYEKADQYNLIALSRNSRDVALLITASKISLARGNNPTALAYCRRAYSLPMTVEQSSEIASIVDRTPRGNA